MYPQAHTQTLSFIRKDSYIIHLTYPSFYMSVQNNKRKKKMSQKYWYIYFRFDSRPKCFM